jgi:DNA-binding NtrC family response regulator
LRERRGDVALLARHFLENEFCAGRAEHKSFSASAMRKLECHSWPGNVRELLNTVRRSFVCAPGRQIMPEHVILESTVAPRQESDVQFSASFRSAKQSAIENFERAYIEDLLQRHQGNVTRAAREAGKERRALGRLIKKYGIRGERTA